MSLGRRVAASAKRTPTGAPPSTAEEPISEAELAKLAGFLDKRKPLIVLVRGSS